MRENNEAPEKESNYPSVEIDNDGRTQSFTKSSQVQHQTNSEASTRFLSGQFTAQQLCSLALH